MSLKEGGKKESEPPTPGEERPPRQVSRLVPVWGFANQTGAEGRRLRKKARIKTNQLCLKVRFPPLNKTILRGEERRIISHSLIIPMLSIIKEKKNHTH